MVDTAAGEAATARRVGARIMDRPEYKAKPKPLCLARSETVMAAVKAMTDKGYGSVMVTDAEGRMEGVVTERDIMTRLVNQKRDAETTKLEDIMTSDVRVAKAEDDVLDWLRIMSNERFRRLPVVDGDNRVQVVMTQGDFVSYTWPDLIYQAKEITKATAMRNFPLVLIGGGVLIYTLAVIVLLQAF